jgi:hypothetical protein
VRAPEARGGRFWRKRAGILVVGRRGMRDGRDAAARAQRWSTGVEPIAWGGTQVAAPPHGTTRRTMLAAHALV